jgi:hypothetical protein
MSGVRMGLALVVSIRFSVRANETSAGEREKNPKLTRAHHQASDE